MEGELIKTDLEMKAVELHLGHLEEQNWNLASEMKNTKVTKW